MRHLLFFLVLLSFALGCSDEEPPRPNKPKPVEAKKAKIGDNVYLEVQGERRRVLVDAVVCLREGPLEQLLCRKFTKEHEAILSAALDARQLHAALIAAGAKPGAPVQFVPQFKPPTGTRVKISLQFDERGKTVTVPAQRWIKNAANNKELAEDWVFAGSVLVPSFEEGKPPFYGANSGDVICVSNFETALLDLPINSPKEDAERSFVAWTDRIPPLDTKVLVILEPVPDGKPAKELPRP